MLPVIFRINFSTKYEELCKYLFSVSQRTLIGCTMNGILCLSFRATNGATDRESARL
jgi:hypothetical protein